MFRGAGRAMRSGSPGSWPVPPAANPAKPTPSDPASYVALPFVRPGLAMVQCDPYVNGEPWPYAMARVPLAGTDWIPGR
jgi:hypothetical protein